MTIIQKTRPITKRENSNIDIIVPFYGNYNKVTNLLESIYKYTYNVPFQVYLVDDHSPNSDYSKQLSTVGYIKVIRNDKQLGFGGSLEVGYKNSTSPYCLFINSDCEIDNVNWLKNLWKSLMTLKNKKVRMVSPLTNNSLGIEKQQLSRSEFVSGLEDEILDINNGEYLSMYCFLCHRDLFKYCRGFIKNYPYGWYEDVEFAHRMNQYGFKQAVCKSSWVFHEGESTIKNLWRSNTGSRQIMQDNEQLYLEDLKKIYCKI